MLKLFLICLFCLISAHGKVLLQGELCGIEGSEVLNQNFTGSVAVAGNGCKSVNNTNCLCAPNLDDPSDSSGFTFQCNGKVQFGPKNNKVCPEIVPVIKRVGVSSIDFTEALEGVPVPCNATIHPTGYPGDESCGYSECESGGSYTAICGCVDFGTRTDPTESSGMQWICIHSTCGCSLTDSGPIFDCFYACQLRSLIQKVFDWFFSLLNVRRGV